MNTCYLMSLVTFVFLDIAFFQSVFHFNIFKANHMTFMVLTSIIYLFTETLIMFFYVGTGVSIKEFSQEHHLGTEFQKRSLLIKRKVYPPQLLNILFMIILFVLVGAVDVGRFPDWGYKIIFIGCLWHFVKIKFIQHQCFKDNTNIILEMSGLKPIHAG